uniref:SH2 domain-containing protein n=1 Tax=Macrostomum lignano TaxID=282301 RepID=A0A1I8FKK4_9PLAT
MRWPGSCSEGCELPADAALSGADGGQDCWKLGFFPDSDWPRQLQPYTVARQPTSQDSTELAELWASLTSQPTSLFYADNLATNAQKMSNSEWRPTRSPTLSTSVSITSQNSSVDGGETPPPLPPKPNSLTSSSLMWQNSQPADWDLAESLAAGRPGDPLWQLPVRADITGSRMPGWEKSTTKNEKVAVFRIRLTPKGYQVSNGHNERLHVSMEALLFHHHIFPIQVAPPQQQEVLLRRPYDLEVLKASPEEGTYALRRDTEGQSVAVLCVKQNHQILKLRISADQDGKQYGFQNDDKTQEGDNSLQKLASRFRPLEGVLLLPPAAAVADTETALQATAAATAAAEAEAADRVCRMQGGNFQLLLRRKDSQKQQPQPASHSAINAPFVEYALLLVRDDKGAVQKFRLMERDTDLSFGPQKLYSLLEKPELVTDSLEKMISLLCVSARILSPDIMFLFMS